ncbi:hypothetical protein DFH06DRAFT_452082 [Mycena polygramma]|nr:hypothetical protein DFH06DRAFT_452082 [Mycena polygramma]
MFLLAEPLLYVFPLLSAALPQIHPHRNAIHSRFSETFVSVAANPRLFPQYLCCNLAMPTQSRARAHRLRLLSWHSLQASNDFFHRTRTRCMTLLSTEGTRPRTNPPHAPAPRS